MKGQYDNGGYLILLVISLGVIMVYFGIVGMPARVIDTHTQQTECKASVYANGMRIAEGFDFLQSAIDCPPAEVTIDSEIDDKVYSTLANESYVCWDNFYRGKMSLFDVERGGEEHFCVICAYINFEGKARDKELKGYPEFLMTEFIPPGINEPQTYYEFLTETKPGSTELILAKTHNGSINTSLPYVVLFSYAKNKGYWDEMGASVGAGAGAFAGVLGVVSLAFSPITMGASGAMYVMSLGIIAGAGAGGVLSPFVDVGWSPGLEIIPFSERDLVEELCYRFEQ